MKSLWIILGLCLLAKASTTLTINNASLVLNNVSVAISPISSQSIVAASCNPEDIETAIASASEGDTITIPAGTCYWTNYLIVTKSVTLQGAGTNSTVIVDERVSRNGIIFLYPTNYNTIMRMTQLQVRGGTTNTGTVFSGVVQVHGTNDETNNAPWRIDHCYFNQQNGRPIGMFAWNGLVDNCYFDQTGGQPGLVFDGQIPDSNNKGHRSWATPVLWGTVDAGVYVESCVFTNTVLRAITDAFTGARYVFRFNTCDNVAAENHGTDTTGVFRSGRSMEIYGNTFTTPTVGESAVHIRGGTGLIFSNTVSGSFPGLLRMANYRNYERNSPYGFANGTNDWDLNFATLYESGTHDGAADVQVLADSTKAWSANQWIGYHVINTSSNSSGQVSASTATTITCKAPISGSSQIWWTTGNTYEIRKINKALDQPGAGMGDLLTGGLNSPPTNPTPIAWPNQADEPIYFWANTGTTNVSNSDDYNIIEGRDYTNAVKSGYTPLTYPHPYASQ